MGCWNETCYLTGLPVFAGEPVQLLFIAASADGQWRPATLPIKGYYDDYGGIESAERRAASLDMLRAARFRINTGGGHEPEPFDNSGLYALDWEKALQELANHAAREELEMLVPGRNPNSEEWRPASVLMAHCWAYSHFVNAIERVQDDLFSSVTFRLETTGPVRMKLRDMSMWDAVDPEDPFAKGIADLARLMAAMAAMRVAFYPTAGKGSQDGMEDGWQLDFQKKRFIRAMAIPHRYDEYEQAPFSAAVAYDENGLMSDRNNSGAEALDLPEKCSPRDLWKRLLGAGLDNLLKAMSEAGTEGK